MAILEGLPGVEVIVCKNGETIEEYNADNDEVHYLNQAAVDHKQYVTVAKYIESTADQEFTVYLRVKQHTDIDCAGLLFRVYADGELVRSALMLKKQVSQKDWDTVVRGPESKCGDSIEVRPMKFARIETSMESLS